MYWHRDQVVLAPSPYAIAGLVIELSSGGPDVAGISISECPVGTCQLPSYLYGSIESNINARQLVACIRVRFAHETACTSLGYADVTAVYGIGLYSLLPAGFTPHFQTRLRNVEGMWGTWSVRLLYYDIPPTPTPVPNEPLTSPAATP